MKMIGAFFASGFAGSYKSYARFSLNVACVDEKARGN